MANIKPVKNKKGISYQVDIRIKGYKRVWKTFFNPDARLAKKEAIAWAADIEKKMLNGTYKENRDFVIDDDRKNIKIMEDLILYFKKNIAPERYADPDKYDCMYDWWIKQLGAIKVTELNSAMLSSCKQYLKTEKIKKGKEKQTTRGNNTINKYLMCLSAVLKYAVNELELIEINPMSKVEPMPKPDGRKRFLSDEEIQKLMKSCKEESEPDATALFFLILLSTGGRYSEVRHLMVENIDFRNNRLLFLDTKNKTSRGVGVDKRLINLIKQYIDNNKINNGYIFLNPKTKKLFYMRGYLQNAIKRAELKDFHIHDIRHTTGSTLARNGAGLLDIAIILGHKTLVMARRYSHLTEQYTDRVLKKAVSTLPIGDNF